MNQLTTIPAEKATLVDIRTDNRRFPRLHSYQREEAIMQMNLLGHSFYVFNDISTGDTCVVYARKDGAYGLIEPMK